MGHAFDIHGGHVWLSPLPSWQLPVHGCVQSMAQVVDIDGNIPCWVACWVVATCVWLLVIHGQRRLPPWHARFVELPTRLAATSAQLHKLHGTRLASIVTLLSCMRRWQLQAYGCGVTMDWAVRIHCGNALLNFMPG